MENKKILGWTPTNIKSLFNYLNGHPNIALINNITVWANKNFKQPLSVRNFFYKLIREAKIDEQVYLKLKALKIDVAPYLEDQKTNETANLLRTVLDYSMQKSVFKACLDFAKGDKNLASKYQNKYRNTLSNHPKLVEQVLKDLHQKGIPTRITYSKTNVLAMPKEEYEGLDSGDIQSLVLGVINLIKNDTRKRLEAEFQQQFQEVNNKFQKVLIDSRRKEVLLNELKTENERIKKSLNYSQNQQKRLQAERNQNYLTLQTLLQSNKQNDLKNFLSNLVLNSQESSN